MTTSTTLDVKVNVSAEVLAYLQRTADTRRVPVDAVISEVLAEYFEEPGKEEILQGIREGFRDIFSGNTRPAREFLDELDREDHADPS